MAELQLANACGFGHANAVAGIFEKHEVGTVLLREAGVPLLLGTVAGAGSQHAAVLRFCCHRLVEKAL